MENIQNYQILQKLDETRGSIIYRGKKEGEKHNVIIKAMKTGISSPLEVARFKQEFELIKSINLNGVIKTYDLIENKNSLVLILEDFNGVSIKSLLINNKKFDQKSFLKISATIAETLGNLHMKNIVHRDIKPHNILINMQTGDLKITDFGISAIITHENNEVYNPDFIIGTLSYMSPEQTGRINRIVDYRTDLYSFGITLYEMITGELPFQSHDPMELIHFHIAVKPSPPVDINPDIPEVLSNIIMKLISKTPEERYQNGFGVMTDLNECMAQFEKYGQIKPFKLGQHDISNRFIIPQKLYGREKEIEILLSDFEKITNRDKSKALVVVSGMPGIGKSALVDELQKSIIAKRGYFISGKYEQYRRDKPYSAIIQAFHELVRQILSESSDMIKIWKERLISALGSHGKLITDVIPNVELIIGKQPDVPVLGPQETRNRFKFIFEKFTNVFPAKEHPVVLFLDDVHWADLASLQLMKNIITNSEIQNFFLIISYRDTEVNEANPLMDFFKEVWKNKINIDRIVLGPLTEKDITNMAVDFLKCSEERGAELAALVHKKTGGNPFFVNQFLRTLYNEKMIIPDIALGWRWDINKIKYIRVTDNLLEMLTGKIGKLSENTQEVLKICACIGNRFDLETVASVRGTSIDQALYDLTEAIREELVSQFEEFYIFQHDRIQEAVYSLVNDEEKSELHYKIGKIALNGALQEELKKKLFYITDQLNLGYKIITSKSERQKLVNLNLEAGKKAKASAAYVPAFKYLDFGISLLDENSWKNQYDLTLALYAESTETAYLMGDLKKMNELADTALKYTRTNLDRTKIYVSRINACIANEEFSEAIDLALPILKLFGIRIPKNPNKLHVVIELLKLKFWLIGKKPEDILNMPVVTDPEIQAAHMIASSVGHAAFYANPNITALLILKPLTLIKKYGITPENAFGFAGYGLVLAAGLKDFKRAIKYGNLGMKLVEKLNAREQECKTTFLFNALVRHWIYSAADSIPPMLAAYRTGLEGGDLDYAGFNLYFTEVHSLYSGMKLPELSRTMAKSNRIIADLNQRHTLTLHSITWQAVLNLLGESDDPLAVKGKAIDAEKNLPTWNLVNNLAALSVFWVVKLTTYSFFGEYTQALHASNMYKKYKDSQQGVIINKFALALDSALRLIMYPDASRLKKIKYIIQIKINQLTMKKWAQAAPMNCLYMYETIEAVYLWVVKKNKERAEKRLVKALELSKKYGDNAVEGIFNEIAAMLYKSINDITNFKKHILNAYSCYSMWGAAALVNKLIKKYPDIISELPSSDATEFDTVQSTTATGTNSESLDLSTVMKATQAISGEIVLEKLLTRMIRIVIENAGAEKGFMILEDKGRFLVEAEAKVGSDSITVLKSIPVESHEGLSASIINFIARTKGTLLLNNAAFEGEFVNDPYVIKNKPKSILCSAILNQGKLSAIIYLENSLITAAFTPERLEILNILSSQIAISIDNAKLYENLEEKVKERTEDLLAAMSELESINERLIETNKKLEQAHMIAARDMAMATQIQTSLFPKTPPMTREWDIAFSYRPMSGVSGDLYDFYENQGQLKGILLMDVSGHGIASGLITMIARPVFDRNFKKGEAEKLSKVMQKANKDMITEIGNVDNYLTGILLRFKDSEVEYVNAAHADLNIKRADSGKAMLISESNKKIKGDIIGVKAIDKAYDELHISIAKNDTLLLYTDCLYESKNSANQEFGVDNILKSFENAPDGSAREILDYILNDLNKFVGNEPFNDDLTVIVVKRRVQ